MSITLQQGAGNHWAPFPANRSKTGHVHVRHRVVDGKGVVCIHMNTGKGEQHPGYPGSPDRVVEIDLTLEQAYALANELLIAAVEARTKEPE